MVSLAGTKINQSSQTQVVSRFIGFSPLPLLSTQSYSHRVSRASWRRTGPRRTCWAPSCRDTPRPWTRRCSHSWSSRRSRWARAWGRCRRGTPGRWDPPTHQLSCSPGQPHHRVRRTHYHLEYCQLILCFHFFRCFLICLASGHQECFLKFF